jgi:hypothetical protein
MVWAAVYAAAWDRQRKRAHDGGFPEGWEATAVQAAANTAGKAVMALASNLDAVGERYGKGSGVDRFAQEVGADPGLEAAADRVKGTSLAEQAAVDELEAEGVTEEMWEAARVHTEEVKARYEESGLAKSERMIGVIIPILKEYEAGGRGMLLYHRMERVE